MRFPKNVRMFDRHVGLLYTRNGTPMQINKKGMADQWAVVKTEFGLIHLEIETKSGKAVQTKDQKEWQMFIESMGGIYILARCANDIIKTIEELIYEY